MSSKECRSAHRILRPALWLGASLLVMAPAVAAESGGGCAQNPSATLDRYAAALKGDPHAAADMFRQVPSGVTLVQDSGVYIAGEGAETYLLPLPDSPSSGLLPSGSRFSALCRVKGQEGEWWLVSKARDGSFAYVAEAKTRKAEDDAPRATEEAPEKRSHDPLFQGRY